ncbi:MAG TPA: ComF family protein [Acidisphaera sp.]|nr:ComF family protein [Acidisphaera sp.]
MSRLSDLLTRLRPAARAVGSTALDLLLPPVCVTCDAAVDRQGQLCAACFRATAFVTAPMCARCGVPFHAAASAGESGLCLACEASPPPYGRARAALRYDAQARRLVLPLKHADRVELARVLAPMMHRAGAALLREADVLVPVPLHRARLRQRRYNQAALLAAHVGRLAGVPASRDALIRRRDTPSLGRRSAALLADAFAVRPGRETAVERRRVILIDDVMTSGATVAACTRALQDAGAARVDVLVAARVPDPRMA